MKFYCRLGEAQTRDGDLVGMPTARLATVHAAESKTVLLVHSVDSQCGLTADNLGLLSTS